MKRPSAKSATSVLRSPRRIFALALLPLVAAYGCSASDAGHAAAGDQAEEELILHSGSVDNAAIVEASTMMLAGDPTSALLDPYNQEDPFGIRGPSYAPTFSRRLLAFDAYDHKTDWRPDQAAAWVARVSSGNYIVVDTSKPCDFHNPHTYLEIERAQMTGRDHATCGGRMPNEDALDVTLNWLIGGPAASAESESAIRDGVDHATRPSADTFPYLAELNGI